LVEPSSVALRSEFVTTVSDHSTDPQTRRDDGDLPALRAGLASFTVVGLCLGAALGVSAILGASLSETAIRVAGSGGLCGFYGLLAVSSSTLHQRSSRSQLAGVIGVLAATVAVVLSLIAIWGNDPLGDAASRALSISVLIAIAVGFAGFLLTQQRCEDPAAIRRLALGTVTIVCVLAIVFIVDIAFATGSVSTNSTSAASSTQGLFTGISFARFVGVTAVVALLGTVLLPVLRRAHPAYRSGSPNKPA
jgi:hypothetical protein